MTEREEAVVLVRMAADAAGGLEKALLLHALELLDAEKPVQRQPDSRRSLASPVDPSGPFRTSTVARMLGVQYNAACQWALRHGVAVDAWTAKDVARYQEATR